MVFHGIPWNILERSNDDRRHEASLYGPRDPIMEAYEVPCSSIASHGERPMDDFCILIYHMIYQNSMVIFIYIYCTKANCWIPRGYILDVVFLWPTWILTFDLARQARIYEEARVIEVRRRQREVYERIKVWGFFR